MKEKKTNKKMVSEGIVTKTWKRNGKSLREWSLELLRIELRLELAVD